MPEVSIIITTHDRSHLLPRAIKSAHASSCRSVEVVVVDDASDEDTARVCSSLPRVKYVRLERNQGVAGARNQGILSSRGEYLSFLDDDDIRLEGSLDEQVDALEGAPDAGFVYGQAIIGLNDGNPTSDFYPKHCPNGDIFWKLLERNFVPCGTAVFRRACLNRVGMLDPAIPGIDDWDLWIRISELYPVLSLERPAIVWRKSTPVSGQGTSNALRIVELSARRFKENWSSLPRVLQSSAQARKRVSRRFYDNMTNHLLWDAVRSMAAGQWLRSQKNILAAMRLSSYSVARALLRPKSYRSLLTHAPKEIMASKNSPRRLPQVVRSRS
ncbi:MAG: glycosyltransferase family 2 protein [Pyrinomonadaceae bacterium]|nr:glycosyltransferase family 2 protein [Pyrinomonadaceae bacterium]